MIQYHDIPRQFNLADYFLDRNLAEGRGDSTALITDERHYTYDETAEATNRAGNVLLSLGVEMEDRVLLALSDRFEFVAAWYAVVKIGAVVAELYTFLQPHDYAYYLNYTRAKVIIVDRHNLQKIRDVSDQCPHLRTILVAGEHEALSENEASLDALMNQVSDRLATAETTKDDIALWKFTTGSTGKPKAAVHCHHDPIISYSNYARGVLDLSESDRVLAVPKLFFGYARDLVTLFPFGVGACGVIFPQRATAELILTLVERHRPTILVNVPTMMNAMARHPKAAEFDMSSLRLNTSAGEALPPAIHQQWLDRFGVETIDGIGSSEAYHIYISGRPGSPSPAGSLGRLVPGYEAEIIGLDGQPAPAGQVGELWISGESTALMYWNEHEKSKQTFVGDTIRTGDLFSRNEDGYFWFQGRADSLLKVGGIWVSPLEVETCLTEHPSVRECVVVGARDDGLTSLRAYVVLDLEQADESLLAYQLQEYVKAQLAPHKYPREVCFVDSLPKTASGKVDRRSLAVWRPNAATSPAASHTVTNNNHDQTT